MFPGAAGRRRGQGPAKSMYHIILCYIILYYSILLKLCYHTMSPGTIGRIILLPEGGRKIPYLRRILLPEFGRKIPYLIIIINQNIVPEYYTIILRIIFRRSFVYPHRCTLAGGQF